MVIEHVIDANLIVGWLNTLGELGGPIKKGSKNPTPPAARVTAAKAGVDFITKFLGDAGTSEAGSDLLKELEKLDRGTTDPDSAEGGVGTENPWPESEGADLVEGEQPSSGD